MIVLPNGTRLVEDASELPRLHNAARLYADWETTSGDPKEDSINPWHDCDPLGLAITADDHDGAWYVPADVPGMLKWFLDVLRSAKVWVNHNIKYDVHVTLIALEKLGVKLSVKDLPELFCTVVQCKLINSDLLSYSLDAVAKHFLHEDITEYEKRLKPYLHKNKDYGAIPVDVLGEYAGQDVLTNRRLDRYVQAMLPAESANVCRTEVRLTKVLVKMERTGLIVDPSELKAVELQILNKMIRLEEKLSKRLGHPFRPHVNEDCFDAFCNTFGMPIKAFTEDDFGEPTCNPSFDKEALKLYLAHPGAPIDFVQGVMDYRKMNTFRNMFLVPYQTLNIDGVLHPNHNQCIRTGRMACNAPNVHQLNKLAKSLIHPRKGYTFMSADYSQIEFRVIVHYINDPHCVKTYNENPDTDFHLWMANMAGMKRRPAKTMNFQMGYGGGKKRAVSSMAIDPDVSADVLAYCETMIAQGRLPREQLEQAYATMCTRKGNELYEKYHDTLPTLKPTAKKAESVCKHRGYVRNLAGRVRKLPGTAAWRAFNSLCQSLAADIQKERTVALDEALDGTGVDINALVHDETLSSGPTEAMEDPRTIRDFIGMMEDNSALEMRVPIRATFGMSSKNWSEATLAEQKWQKVPHQHFDHLKALST